MKRALLLYAPLLFDPRVGRETTGSAGVIAKSLYTTLIERGYEVTYIGPDEAATFPLGEYDLFVGQPDRWVPAARRSGARVKILFPPTTHPLRRNRLMRQAAGRWGVAPEELLPAHPEALQALEMADFIMQIGNEAAIEALLRHGVACRKIIHIHYGVRHLPIPEGALCRDLSSFVYLAAALSLRKGFPEILEFFEGRLKEKRLTIMALHAPEPWAARLSLARRKHPEWKVVLGLQSNEPTYREILSLQSWLLFPTVEEAEPGTVLEAMSQGIVPILDRARAGVDFSVTANPGAVIAEQIEAALRTTPEQWSRLSRRARRYVEVIHRHSDWEERLKRIWGRMDKAGLCRGPSACLAPHASLILSVHEKEETIGGLLRLLWKTTRSYPQWDLHIIYDGCTDNTRSAARKALARFKAPVYEYEKKNIFEVRSNNFGLRQAGGEYCVILQDDLFIKEPRWLEKMVAWMEEHPRVAVLGGLAGVNFFPCGAQPAGPGVMIAEKESFRRLDWRIEPSLRNQVYEVDAVMRGPLVLRKQLLEERGYLDEAYAPLYDDDMDYCFRLRELGYAVFCFPIDVENRRLTMARCNPAKAQFFAKTMKANADLLYQRWEPAMGKHDSYLRLPRPRWQAGYDPRSAFGRIRDCLVTATDKTRVRLNLALSRLRRLLH